MASQPMDCLILRRRSLSDIGCARRAWFMRIVATPRMSSGLPLHASAHLTAAATLGFGVEPYTQEFYDEALAQHLELVGHVVRGEAEEANRCAQAHFRLTLDTMRAGLQRARGGQDHLTSTKRPS